MTFSTVLPTTREALLGPRAQRLEVGLLSARTAAVLRRIIAGMTIDEMDRGVIRVAQDMMSMAADAVEVVAAGGQLKRDRRSLGFGAMAFAVESATSSVSPADVPKYLRKIASSLEQVLTTGDVDLSRTVLQVFSTLADVATRQAGAVGEGRGTLI